MEVPTSDQTTAANDPDFIAVASSDDLAGSLFTLSNRLGYMSRREDALLALQEAWLYRRLAAERLATFNPDFASSLNNLSLRLADMGRKDGLRAIQEAV
jgi:hypothetical protein